jgi:hypothetical protein
MAGRIEWVIRYRSKAFPDGNELVAYDERHAEQVRVAVIQSGFTLMGDTETRPFTPTKPS